MVEGESYESFIGDSCQIHSQLSGHVLPVAFPPATRPPAKGRVVAKVTNAA